LIEISAAWGHGKRIIAIIDKVAPEEMPEIMLPYKAIDLNDLTNILDSWVNAAKERVNE